MADDGLLVPDTRIVSIDEAKSEKARPSHARQSDYITRKEFAATVLSVEDTWKAAAAAGVVAMGQKMYDQVSGELAENFDDMQHQLNQNLDARFARVYAEIEEKYTWRGRWRRIKDWARGWGMELGVISPISEPSGRAQLVMDEQARPGVVNDFIRSEAERREWIREGAEP